MAVRSSAQFCTLATQFSDASSHLSGGLGQITLVPELVGTVDPALAGRSFAWLIIGAKKLKTDKLAFPPDPYLQIYRKLADGTLAPVHQTVHVKRQRDCVWKTAPIAVQLSLIHI